MPIKYNLTKYDMLSTRIKKVSIVKKNLQTMTPEDKDVMFKAVLIACFASGHSWQTFKTLTTSNNGFSYRSPELKQEYQDAVNSKWKTITPFDIVEVSTNHISDSSFSQWLFFNVEKEHQIDYKKAWQQLQTDFDEDCDVIERTLK